MIKGVNKVGKMSGDLSDAMSKMGTSMGGDMGGSKKKKKTKSNGYDDYSKLGKRMMDGSGF